ncbi:MAG: hypothetical protein P9L99_12320 [Candidatus Lernaella stagnicola]|nr:hypothetical protein [Candidatus Lernaella stagnicola]
MSVSAASGLLLVLAGCLPPLAMAVASPRPRRRVYVAGAFGELYQEVLSPLYQDILVKSGALEGALREAVDPPTEAVEPLALIHNQRLYVAASCLNRVWADNWPSQWRQSEEPDPRVEHEAKSSFERLESSAAFLDETFGRIAELETPNDCLRLVDSLIEQAFRPALACLALCAFYPSVTAQSGALKDDYRSPPVRWRAALQTLGFEILVATGVWPPRPLDDPHSAPAVNNFLRRFGFFAQRHFDPAYMREILRDLRKQATHPAKVDAVYEKSCNVLAEEAKLLLARVSYAMSTIMSRHRQIALPEFDGDPAFVSLADWHSLTTQEIDSDAALAHAAESHQLWLEAQTQTSPAAIEIIDDHIRPWDHAQRSFVA